MLLAVESTCSQATARVPSILTLLCWQHKEVAQRGGEVSVPGGVQEAYGCGALGHGSGQGGGRSLLDSTIWEVFCSWAESVIL